MVTAMDNIQDLASQVEVLLSSNPEYEARRQNVWNSIPPHLTPPIAIPKNAQEVSTVVKHAVKTGASFTLPILETVLGSTATTCTKRVDFMIAARQGDEIGFYQARLREAVEKAKVKGIELRIHISVTGDGQLR